MKLTDLVPGAAQLKTVGTVLAAGAFAATVIGWSITAHTLGVVREWQRTVVAATSHAARVTDGHGAPALLAPKKVPEQIALMGDALEQVRTLSAKAIADNQANNTRIGVAQQHAAEETGDEVERRIAEARAAGAAAAGRMRGACPASADRGGASAPDANPQSDAAGGADRAGRVSVVDEEDVRICSDNTVKALGWQAWNARIDAIPREGKGDE